ncbi:MAG TPA: glycine cleavage system aminomethyltransferase GcvT [Caulobacteraceae bacterium]|nr:glycine cleavage system aminomethyltransferase GcvT [Caulobacteraceae bacterium]
MSDQELKTTLLTAGHRALGARMVAFAGYSMPLQFPSGILEEHLWTREHAGLFDVSHMGPAFLALADRSGEASADHRAIAAVVETLVCGDIAGLKPGRLRYTLMLNEDGGIVDDLMVGRPAEPDRQGELFLVVNAGTKDADFAALSAAADGRASLRRADDRALIALQGPQAAEVMAAILPETSALDFMSFARIDFEGDILVVSRSGYTGEDGFEILVSARSVGSLGHRLLADERVAPVGLGARDSLRLEAALPLYGHDLDQTVSPIEAGLAFAVSKRRRKAGDFPGSARITRELADGAARLRVGLKVLEGAPAREGAAITREDGAVVGRVTSGGYAPSIAAPIAMGFVPPALATVGAPLKVVVRGKAQAAEVVAMPFVPHRYHR